MFKRIIRLVASNVTKEISLLNQRAVLVAHSLFGCTLCYFCPTLPMGHDAASLYH